MHSSFFVDIAYVFLAAMIGGFVALRLKQPLVIGFVLGGLLVGPFTPGPVVHDVSRLELLAEIGVILLMYSIGMEFSFKDLLRVRWVALFGSMLGIALAILLGMATAPLMGLSFLQSGIVGAIISVASTMVLARQLIDRGELRSAHGRVMIGITLVEDFAVVAMTILIPVFGSESGMRLDSALLGIGKSLLLLAPIAFAAAKLIPRILSRVAAAQNDELFIVVLLAMGFGTAAITEAVGLSLALGAFLAGILISGSSYAHKTLARVLPLRDAFVALFFVTVGLLIDPRTLIRQPVQILVILLLVVVGKAAIWALVIKIFRYPTRVALLAALGLTQIGEFSFVLVKVAHEARILGDDVYNSILGVSLLSILLNAVLFRLGSKWIQGADTPAKRAQEVKLDAAS